MYAKDKVTIQDRREMLRVKLKSLAEEARIIRKEERRSWGALRHELWVHRVGPVRFEARAAHLAYGLLRGRTMQQMEQRDTFDSPVLQARVDQLLKKYGPVKLVLAKAA